MSAPVELRTRICAGEGPRGEAQAEATSTSASASGHARSSSESHGADRGMQASDGSDAHDHARSRRSDPGHAARSARMPCWIRASLTPNLVLHVAPLPLVPAAIVVLYTAEGMPPRGHAAEIWAATGLDFGRVSTAAGFAGKQGQVLDIAAPEGVGADRLLVLGTGKLDPDKPMSDAAWADRGGSLAAKLLAANAETVAIVLDGHEAMPVAIWPSADWPRSVLTWFWPTYSCPERMATSFARPSKKALSSATFR